MSIPGMSRHGPSLNIAQQLRKTTQLAALDGRSTASQDVRTSTPFPTPQNGVLLHGLRMMPTDGYF
jgi:hypothetical protein